MAHEKLTDEDDGFLNLPEGAVLLSSGVNGAESWIQRDKTATVRIVMSTVAVATGSAATLEAVIEIDGAQAKAQDGPNSPDDHHKHLQTTISVQVVAKEGETLKFRAFPEPQGARVLKTVVYAADIKPA